MTATGKSDVTGTEEAARPTRGGDSRQNSTCGCGVSGTGAAPQTGACLARAGRGRVQGWAWASELLCSRGLEGGLSPHHADGHTCVEPHLLEPRHFCDTVPAQPWALQTKPRSLEANAGAAARQPCPRCYPPCQHCSLPCPNLCPLSLPTSLSIVSQPLNPPASSQGRQKSCTRQPGACGRTGPARALEHHVDGVSSGIAQRAKPRLPLAAAAQEIRSLPQNGFPWTGLSRHLPEPKQAGCRRGGREWRLPAPAPSGLRQPEPPGRLKPTGRPTGLRGASPVPPPAPRKDGEGSAGPSAQAAPRFEGQTGVCRRLS